MAVTTAFVHAAVTTAFVHTAVTTAFVHTAVTTAFVDASVTTSTVDVSLGHACARINAVTLHHIQVQYGSHDWVSFVAQDYQSF